MNVVYKKFVGFAKTSFELSIIFLFSSSAYSAEDVSSQLIESSVNNSSISNNMSNHVNNPMSSGYLTQLVLGLIVVIACIVALAWLSKKMNRFQSVSDNSLKILSGISMGSREKIVLLQVGEEQLLVGVSPGRINKLHVLAAPIQSAKSNKDNTEDKGFADKLKTIMADATKASLHKK